MTKIKREIKEYYIIDIVRNGRLEFIKIKTDNVVEPLEVMQIAIKQDKLKPEEIMNIKSIVNLGDLDPVHFSIQ